MATTKTPKFELGSVDLTAAARPFLAGVGATDLAVEYVREYAADAQKKLAEIQTELQKGLAGIEPTALRDQTVAAAGARFESLSKDTSARFEAFGKDAKARRAAVEARVAALQEEAKALPAKVQALLNENVAAANGAYDELVKRGETLVGRMRAQEAPKATKKAAKSTAPKAKTTKKAATSE